MLHHENDTMNSLLQGGDANLLEECSWWTGLKAGNRHSFSLLYHKYYRILYTYGFHLSRDKELVRDCIQDLFFTLWKNRETLIQPGSIKNYLFTAFKRKLVDGIKKKAKSVHAYEEGDFEMVFSHEHTWISEEASQEQISRLQQAMKSLTKRQKEAIYLRYFENMAYPEIATLLDCEINSVYVLMSRSMDTLRKAFLPTLFLLWWFLG